MLNASSAVLLREKNDEQLVLLAKEPNEEAFAILVARYLPMLQRLSQQFRSKPFEREDLVQEGLMALLSAVRTYRAERNGSFRTYAYVCSRNRMVSALRRDSAWDRVGDTEPFVEDDGCCTSKTDDPAEVFYRREEWEQLRNRIRGALTDSEYQVLMLYLASYSYREIAERLQITEKAVDNALQRMRRKLAVMPI